MSLQVKWIEKIPDETLDLLPKLIKQSDNYCETSNCQPPVFVPQGGDGAAQPNENDVSITPINAPEGVPPIISFVELDEAAVALKQLSWKCCEHVKISQQQTKKP